MKEVVEVIRARAKFAYISLTSYKIRRAGRWNNGDQMTGCYLTSFSRPHMRSSAGFDPDWAGVYHIGRAIVKPPLTLAQRVWPELDKWRMAHTHPERSLTRVEPNKAAGAFLELLDWLREVFLQDSAYLIQEFPTHPIWQDPLFASAEYLTFASNVRATAEVAIVDSYTVAIKKAVPAMASKMTAMMAQQQSNHSLLANKVDTIYQAVFEMATTQQHILEAVQDQEPFTITFTPGGRRGRKRRQYTVAHHSNHPPPPLVVSPNAFIATIPESPVTPTPTPNLNPLIATTPISESPPVPRIATSPSVILIPLPLSGASPPAYEIPTNVKSVAELVGLWDGSSKRMPAIEQLESLWGNRWRPVRQKQYFSERKRIMDEVKRRSTITQREWKVVAIEMDRQKGNKSLNAYFKLINKRLIAGFL